MSETIHVVMGYDHEGFGTLYGAFSTGELADEAMRPKTPREKPKGVATEGQDLVAHEVPINGALREYLVYPRTQR